MIHASDLRKISNNELDKYLKQLTAAQVDELIHTWEFWARPNQLEPDGNDWDYWIFNAGRGAGKTRSGAEWVRHRIKSGDKRVACVAPTKGDVRRVMVEGESGLLNVCWKLDKTYKGASLGFPVWSPTNSTLTWANGAVAQFFSAEDPERLRGPQFHSAWADETAAWRNQQDVWDMLSLCMRLGKHPRVMVTTTPKPTKLMRFLLKHPKALLSTGSTFDNSDNLADTYLQAVRDAYEGTRLGRQELYAEILEEAEGALWSTELLDSCVINDDELPAQYARIIVSVDPAITSNEESDMTGIIVAATDFNGTAYILEDATDRFTPQGWASKAVELYNKYGADRIVAERNQGGEMVRHTLHTEDDTIPVRMVHASRGKYARAEPVSALYERGKVKHVKGLDELETQMRTWEPLGSIGSPDRLDAMVWAVTDLILKGVAQPQMNIVYKNAKGLSSNMAFN
jgi:phage terminase large subunit-like protein